MQLDFPRVAFPRRGQLPNPPGRTPVPTRISEGGTAVHRDKSGGGVATAAASPGRSKALHWLPEFVEDVMLLLIIVFMVPGIIMLLALPLVVVVRLAAEIATRW